MSKSLPLVLAVASLVLQSGCAVFQPLKEVNDYVVRSLRPNPHDYRDSTDDEEDEWSFVGKEARGNMAPESSNDPLRKYLTSPKARSIEANLGYRD